MINCDLNPARQAIPPVDGCRNLLCNIQFHPDLICLLGDIHYGAWKRSALVDKSALQTQDGRLAAPDLP